MNSNDNNMNDLIKKAQEMIKNNQIPDELRQMVNNMSSNNSENIPVPHNSASNSNSDTNSHNNTLNNNAGSSSSKIDMNDLMQMVSNLNNQTSDDDMSRLLFALKPYLRNERKDKVDEYIKLIRMGKMAQLFDMLNNQNKK